MIGHLGTRVSALLDGQLSPADEERAWDHVHSCHQCRDAVEREGWVKTRLATMQYAGSSAPSSLKGSLKCSLRGPGLVADWDLPEPPALVGVAGHPDARRRHLGLTGIGGGAVGAAVMGVLALGASPANAPGGVVQPTTDAFGSSLTNVIASVIDRDHGGRGNGLASHAQRARHSAARTLAP